MPSPARTYHQGPLQPFLVRALAKHAARAGRESSGAPLAVLGRDPCLAERLQLALARHADTPILLDAWTWEDLAAAVLHATGAPVRPLTSAAAEEHALQQLDPETFPARDQAGWRRALRAHARDLADAGWSTPRHLERAIVAHAFDLAPDVRRTLEAILEMRRRLHAALEDRATRLERATRALDARHASHPASLESVLGTHAVAVLDTTLAPVELAFLEALSRHVEVVVYVDLPGGTPSALARQLEARGFRRPAAGAPATPPAAHDAPPAPVTVHRCSSTGAETAHLVRLIWQAARDGVAFEDIALASRDTATRHALRAGLEAAGIPVQDGTPVPLASTRSGRALMTFLDTLAADAGWEPVGDFLAVARLPAATWAGDATLVPAALERVAREAYLGTQARDWPARLGRLAARLRADAARRAARGDEDTAAAAVVAEVDRLRHVLQRLRMHQKRFPARDSWTARAGACTALLDDMRLALPERTAMQAALAALAHLDALGAARPDRATFAAALAAELDARTLPPDTSCHGGVRLGAPEDLAGSSFDVILVAGMEDGVWPRALAEEPLLADRDRQRLGELLGVVDALRPRRARRAAERDAWQRLRHAARKQVHATWCETGRTGGDRARPSRFLEPELRPSAAGASTSGEGAHAPPDTGARRPVAAPALAAAADATAFDLAAMATLAPRARRRYLGALAPRQRPALGAMLARHHRRGLTAYEGVLGDPAAHPDIAPACQRAHAGSASRLVTFVTCPFRFFAAYVLGLDAPQAPPPWSVSPLDRGRVVHRVLESVYRDLAGHDLLGAPFETWAERVRAHLGPVLEEPGALSAPLPAVLHATLHHEIEEDVLRWLRREHRALQSGDPWHPQVFEGAFGPGRSRTFAIRTRAGEVAFRGIVDRVDAARDHDGVRVVDYKTGRPARKEDPRALQLVLYLLAWVGDDAARLRRSEACFAYVTRRGGFDLQRLRGAAVAAFRDPFERLVDAVSAQIAAGRFAPAPGPRGAHCNGCDFVRVCDPQVADTAARKAPAHPAAVAEVRLPLLETASVGAPDATGAPPTNPRERA